jgi:hypothetical protein
MMGPKGPYKLCTVNTAPERAKRVVGRLIEDLKDTYIITHVENAASASCLLLQAWCLPSTGCEVSGW